MCVLFISHDFCSVRGPWFNVDVHGTYLNPGHFLTQTLIKIHFSLKSRGFYGPPIPVSRISPASFWWLLVHVV